MHTQYPFPTGPGRNHGPMHRTDMRVEEEQQMIDSFRAMSGECRQYYLEMGVALAAKLPAPRRLTLISTPVSMTVRPVASAER